MIAIEQHRLRSRQAISVPRCSPCIEWTARSKLMSVTRCGCAASTALAQRNLQSTQRLVSFRNQPGVAFATVGQLLDAGAARYALQAVAPFRWHRRLAAMRRALSRPKNQVSALDERRAPGYRLHVKILCSAPFLLLGVLLVASGCTINEAETTDSPETTDTSETTQTILPANREPDGPRSTSRFEADADGWTITGDAQSERVEPDYDGQGGNPDGLISATDDVTGGVWYFQAPSKYLGNASATYGKFLDFDLKTSAISSPFESFDVVLTGAGMSLGFDATTRPTVDVWNSYAIGLDEAAGWRIMSELSEEAFADFAMLPAPTRDQMNAVLADLTRLLIRGEFQNGADTGYLDNVRFGAGE